MILDLCYCHNCLYFVDSNFQFTSLLRKRISHPGEHLRFAQVFTSKLLALSFRHVRILSGAAAGAVGPAALWVVTGGHYDVDCRLEDPDGTTLYKEMKKQYDSFTFTASKNGTYKFCFSNEFSTFTHKTVYFDFQVGDDPPLFPNENRVTALTQMESACVSIHEALKSVIDYQTHFRLREAQGRSRAEDLNTRVAFWSIGEAIILLVVSISQVVLLRSFFSDKKTTTTRVGS
ncbi:transmembrane emp24 domain-containing protein 7-like protein [Lates japonicus]|uniref:Transmembrane emp24 domain-containing protein 7-like protein n=1 Tax=Lates japonicus TaxID=270547 RepID=A0AAD3MIG7_LATJO|nr:transmembrane emp24 domain-containing protein 7-like protein [Lates japonicus]